MNKLLSVIGFIALFVINWKIAIAVFLILCGYLEKDDDDDNDDDDVF